MIKSLNSCQFISRLLQVETAYDLLLMQSMQKRLQGQLSSQSVRFADVVPEPTTYQVCSATELIEWHKCDCMQLAFRAACLTCMLAPRACSEGSLQ